MDYTIKDLVQQAALDNAVKAAEVFDSLIADRIVDAVQAKKIELAQTIFNGHQIDTEEEDQDEDSEANAE